jgi:hypothetical protein
MKRKTAQEISDELSIQSSQYSHEDILTMQNNDLISLVLWTTRRLSHKQYKDFTYDELEKITGKSFERV